MTTACAHHVCAHTLLLLRVQVHGADPAAFHGLPERAARAAGQHFLANLIRKKAAALAALKARALAGPYAAAPAPYVPQRAAGAGEGWGASRDVVGAPQASSWWGWALRAACGGGEVGGGGRGAWGGAGGVGAWAGWRDGAAGRGGAAGLGACASAGLAVAGLSALGAAAYSLWAGRSGAGGGARSGVEGKVLLGTAAAAVAALAAGVAASASVSGRRGWAGGRGAMKWP